MMKVYDQIQKMCFDLIQNTCKTSNWKTYLDATNNIKIIKCS